MIVYDSQYKQLKTGFRHSTENTVHICEALLRNNLKKNRRDLRKENYNSIQHPILLCS